MKSNICNGNSREKSKFVPHFSLPELGGAKFTPKAGYASLTQEQVTKMFQGKVKGITTLGSVNNEGYGIFLFLRNNEEVGTISFYESELDEESTQKEIDTTTKELVVKLKTAKVTVAVEKADLSDW